MLDTIENRKKILKLVRDRSKRLCYQSKHGNMWYAEILPNGTQLWAFVRISDGSSVILSCGLNIIPRL